MALCMILHDDRFKLYASFDEMLSRVAARCQAADVGANVGLSAVPIAFEEKRRGARLVRRQTMYDERFLHMVVMIDTPRPYLAARWRQTRCRKDRQANFFAGGRAMEVNLLATLN
jgi:hypothetical protein